MDPDLVKLGVVTPPLTHLAKRQKAKPSKYPPLNGLDRAQQLFGVLEPTLPETLRIAYKYGSLAIGEIGEHLPDMRAIPIDPDGFVIEFNSGMMEFVYSVARASSGLVVVHSADGPLNTQSLELPSVAVIMAQTFKKWRRFTRWAQLWPFWRGIKYPSFPISKDILGITENLATTAELFLLAHELAHVAINAGWYPHLSDNEEEDADVYGFRLFFPAAEDRVGVRRAIASVVFAVRIFAVMERLGYSFTSQYPPQARRVELLLREMRSSCVNDQHFHEASTILMSYQDLMDEVEKVLGKSGGAVSPSVERELVRMIAQLEALTRGQLSKEIFFGNMLDSLGRVPDSVLRQASVKLKEYYMTPPSGSTFYTPAFRQQMSTTLFTIVPELPMPFDTFFSPNV